MTGDSEDVGARRHTDGMVDTKLTKSAGEHHVCSVLSRLGWGAALTRDGLERTDILAVSTTGPRRVIEVQVKAANGSNPATSWPLGLKSQQAALSDAEWFVLVALPADPVEPPRCFVVPRDHVAAAAWIVHQAWLTDPTIEPGKRNVRVDRARVALHHWEGYENRWDLLKGSTHDAPVLLPASVREQATLERVGLPPEHPWHDELPEW